MGRAQLLLVKGGHFISPNSTVRLHENRTTPAARSVVDGFVLLQKIRIDYAPGRN
jgi:hypothetical protein